VVCRLASLEDRNFRVYWSINAAFFVGQGLIQIGAQWLMIGLTDSRSAIGALGAVQGGCTILLSPLGGILSDRVPKRNLLIWMRIGLSALMAIMTVLLVTKNVQVWHLFGSVALLGAVLALSQSATQTYVLDIVGRDPDHPSEDCLLLRSARKASTLRPGVAICSARYFSREDPSKEHLPRPNA
jgi:MFS family permease